MKWQGIFILAGVAGMFALIPILNYLSKRPLSPREKERQRREIEEQEAFRRSRPWANDPIGDSIEWTGLRGGGSLGIRSVSGSRVEFRLGDHPTAFYVIIFLMAAGGAIAIYSSSGSVTQVVVCLSVGIGFNAIVWLVVHFANTPVVFDKQLGMFWKGREQPSQLSGDNASKCQGRIADIEALQAFSTYRWNGDKVYNTFQLNLVMKGGARLVVSTRDDGESLLKDAKVLSEFLGKPLWERC